jgi:outer membrane receptor protein involved in Fe transport
LAVLVGSGPLAEAQAVSRFNLPAQPLAESLHALASQTDTNLLFDPPLVARLEAPALKGSFTLDEALNRLLAGTDIRHQFLNEKTIVLTTSGAKGAPVGHQATGETDPPVEQDSTSGGQRRDLRLAQSAGGLSDATPNAGPSQSADVSQSVRRPKETGEEPVKVEEIIVTGSRIARPDLEGPTPVTILTGEELEAQGYTTVYEAMNSLTQSFQTETPPSWGSTTVNARQLNLRGLGANHSLLLVDGLRVADYPQPAQGGSNNYNFQNLNNLPAGMVDRIEILGTGGSSIYGSDAIAGVANVILKHNYTGDTFSVRGGGAVRGGRDLIDISWTGGKSLGDLHVVYNFQYFDRSPLWGYNRPYTDSDASAGYGTWSPADRQYGYQRFPGLFLDSGGSSITPPAGACTQPGFHNEFLQLTGPPGSRYANGTYCAQRALFENWVLTPGRRDWNGYVYGDYDFGNNVKAYAALALYRTTGISNTQLPFLYTMGGLPNPFYDKNSGQLIDNYLRQLTAAEMGTRGNTYDREGNWDIHFGLKGSLFDGKLGWDATVGRALYWVNEDYTGLNEQGMFNFFFGQQLGTAADGNPIYAVNANRFWNPITPADYATFGVNGENRATSWMNQGQLLLTGNDLLNLWGGPLGAAAVFEAAHQGFQLYPDPRGNTTTFGDPFQNYNIGGGQRTRYSGAAELRLPIVPTLTASLAGRIDKYDDASKAGTAKTWSSSIEWRPVQKLLIRGSYGTNFHAPDMINIYSQGASQQVGIYADYYQCILQHQASCPPVPHNTYFTQYSGGNPNLVPETGRNWSYGFVVDPTPNLTFSVDYVRIELDDIIKQIDLNTALTDEAGCRTGLQVSGAPYTAHTLGSDYCRLVIDDVSRDANGNITSAHIGPINEAYLSISSIDTAMSYRWTWGQLGAFKLDLIYTRNLHHLSKVLTSDPLLDDNYASARGRGTASLNWNKGQWDATLYGRYVSSVRDPRYGSCESLPDGTQPNLGDANCVVHKGMNPEWYTASASAAYRFFHDRAKATLYVSNLFNRVGEIPYYSSAFEFISILNGADYNGREWSLQLQYKID